MSPHDPSSTAPHRPAEPASPAPGRDAGLPDPIPTATRALFRSLAFLRRKRAVHPRGVAFHATVTVLDGGPALPLPRFSQPGAQLPAVVRLSNSIGLPDPLPDVRGLAVRLPDLHGRGRHQDFLLDSCGEGPLLQRAFLPALGYGDRAYSSILPYEAGDQRVLIGARYEGDSLDGHVRLGDLPTLAGMGRLQFQLAMAPVWGRWQPVAQLDVGARLPQSEADALHFHPWNTGPGLRPVGLLNRLRAPAYRSSEEGSRASAAR